jgi:hypothetical protein
MTDFQIFALLAPPGLVFLVAAFVLAEEYFNRREMRLETGVERAFESSRNVTVGKLVDDAKAADEPRRQLPGTAANASQTERAAARRSAQEK